MIVVLLVAAIVEFTHGTRIAILTAANFRNGVQATFLAKSGVTAAQAILKDDAKNSAKTDDLTEIWALPLPPFEAGGGSVALSITDEAGKISLERLGNPNDVKKVHGVLKRLFRNLGIHDAMADRVRDWIDPDATAEGYGIEDTTNRNARLDSLEELLGVRGMTPEIFDKISPYLTVTDAWPININTADPVVLLALDDELGEDGVRKLIDGRPHQDFALPNIHATIATRIRAEVGVAYKSNYFSVISEAMVEETAKTVKAVIHRSGTKTRLQSWQIR